MTASPLSDRILPAWLVCAFLAVILLASLALHFNNLGHPGVKDLDEAYHAIVARSMLDDPLKPTFYATPYLPYDYRNWQGNHVWLHKPPVALWQIAASFATFGESNFTLRLPSALLATAAVALTFLLGRSLATAEAGLIAALLQSLSPAITRLVHGQVFSDHVDVAMLFWCEMAVWLLIRAARTGRTSDAALVGVTQAIAWLSKSYPGGFVALLAITLFIWPRAPSFRLTLRQLIAFVIAAIVTAAPWTIWCLVKYPREFLFEQAFVFSHLYLDVETFAAPWDRLLFDYLMRGLLEWYALAIVAVGIVSFDAIRRRDPRRLLIAAWAWFVLIPHLLATSKTPTATLIGWPAAWLAIGIVISDALRRRPFAIGATFAAVVLLVGRPQLPGASALKPGTPMRFGAIAIEHWQVAASAVLIAMAGLIAHFLKSRGVPAPNSGPKAARLFILLSLAFAWPLANHLRVAIRVSRDAPADALAFPELGRFVRAKSPKNAVFLVDEQTRGEAVIAMWWLDRECYPLHDETLADEVGTIAAHGGEPFILSRRGRAERELPGVVGEAKIFVPPLSVPTGRP